MEIVKIILPVITLIIGALLQFIFSTINNNLKHNKDLEFNAYSKYLESVSNISISLNQSDENEYRKALFTLAEAKTKIVSYGKGKIIKKLAKLESVGVELSKPESMEVFLELIKEIRIVTKKYNKNEKIEDYKVILFGVSSRNSQ